MGASSSKKTKAPPGGVVTEADRQVLGLKTQKRKLKAYAKRVEDAIGRESEKARTLAKTPGRKAHALNALKRRKVQEQLATRIDAWLLQVEELLSSIEQAQVTAAVLQRLKQGNEALKAAQAGYTLDDVANILQDMDDAKEHQEDVNRLILDNLSDADNEAVEAEFAALQDAEAAAAGLPTAAVRATTETENAAAKESAAVAAEMPEVPTSPETAPELPDAPKGLQTSPRVEDEEDARESRTLLPA